MPISRRHLVPIAVLVAGAACVGSAAGQLATTPQRAPSAATVTSVCGLHLQAPRLGEPAFRIPSGGRAARRLLAGGFSVCNLFRRDGSRFADLHSDSQHRVLGLAFFRQSGALLFAGDESLAATAGSGSNVECGSSSQASISPHYWRKAMKWWIGATVSGIDRDAVVKAVRNALSEWVNDTNWCGIKDQANVPTDYEGKTSAATKHDGKSVVDWGSLKNDQDCNGALACTGTWYAADGTPVESDIRFNNAFKWSAKGAEGKYDIQTVAAHEFGHVIQFDHVDNSGKDDETNLMWPYLSTGETSGHKLGRGDALEDNSHY